MLRVGLAGCGFIGRVHAWALWALRRSSLVDAALVAVFDHDPERADQLAAPHEARTVSSSEALCDAVDVVYVCTPTAEHAAIVDVAVSRGLAIFCEKPLATDLAGAERIATALRRVPHQVGLVLRAAPVFRRLNEVLASGVYGRVMTLHLRDDQFFPTQGHYASSWRAQVDVAGGGTLIEHSIHDLDLFRWLLGDPEEISCRTASFFGHPGIEDLAVATLTYPGGVIAGLTSVWHQVLTRPSTRRLEVFSEQALIWTDDDYTGPLHIETSDGSETLACPPEPWVDQLPVPEGVRRPLGHYAQATKAFLERIHGTASSASLAGAEDALAAHRLVAEAYRSALDGGRPLRL